MDNFRMQPVLVMFCISKPMDTWLPIKLDKIFKEYLSIKINNTFTLLGEHHLKKTVDIWHDFLPIKWISKVLMIITYTHTEILPSESETLYTHADIVWYRNCYISHLLAQHHMISPCSEHIQDYTNSHKYGNE